MARICRFLRRYGVKAVDVNYHDTWLNYQCSVNLRVNELPEEEQFRAIDVFAKEAIEKYDIFHFHFGRSLYRDFRDLEILKSKGKKIVFSFWGSDQRSPEWIYYQQAKFLGYNPPKPYFFTKAHYNLHKYINCFADVLLGSTCIPRGLWIPGQIDINEWSIDEKLRIKKQCSINKKAGKVYFLHAPSKNWKKGSQLIMNELKTLQEEGLPIEVLYVSRLRQEEARKVYAFADFVIDQVGIGTFGLLGIEMMSWKIPVLAYQTKLFDRIRNYPPVIKITKDNFKNKILHCIDMKLNDAEKYESLSEACRQWALVNADISQSIDQYISIYGDLANDRVVKQYPNLSWYREEAKYQSGFRSDFYDYMNRENVFEQLGIRSVEIDDSLYNCDRLKK